MYCKNCGGKVEENSKYCTGCGAKIDSDVKTDDSDGGINIVFAVLGFIIPIVGLILFLVYEGTKPKRAKAAGKGALIGFIAKIALSIILVVFYTFFASSLFGLNFGKSGYNLPNISSIFQGESTDEILKNELDITFGEFKVEENYIYSETSLEVTVKNKSKSCAAMM